MRNWFKGFRRGGIVTGPRIGKGEIPAILKPGADNLSDELRAALERAKNHKMTPEEKFLQKVSFVYGQQDYDNPNPLSKRRIAEMIAEQQGYPAEWVQLVPDPSPIGGHK